MPSAACESDRQTYQTIATASPSQCSPPQVYLLATDPEHAERDGKTANDPGLLRRRRGVARNRRLTVAARYAAIPVQLDYWTDQTIGRPLLWKARPDGLAAPPYRGVRAAGQSRWLHILQLNLL